MTFGAALLRMREHADLQVPALAERSGISQSDLVAIEAGRCDPTWDQLTKLAGVLSMRVFGVLPDVPGEKPVDKMSEAELDSMLRESLRRMKRGPHEA